MMNRRTFLVTGAAGLSALATPNLLQAQGTPLKVGTYGGFFQDSFDKHIFPDFTAETGIAVESIGEPTGEAWLVQLEQAARAKPSPGRRLHDGAGRAPAGRGVAALGAA